MGQGHMTEEDIRALLPRLRDPDQAAFGALYREFSSRVERFVMRGMSRPDKPLAEEIVSDTFVAVWRSPERFDGSSKFMTWLFGIARNQLLHRLRSERSWSAREDFDEVPEQWDETADPYVQISQRQRAAALLQCADRLNPDQRMCLYLMHVEEMSQGEISQVMGVPVNTVKSRVREAIKRILPCVTRMLAREGEAVADAVETSR